MKSVYVIAVALVAACSAETYDTKHDNFNIDAVAADPEKLQTIVNCFLGKEECNSQADDFKKVLPEVIQHACAKCTPAQKYLTKIFFNALQDKLPAEYEVYRLIYDPDNIYFGPLRAAVENTTRGRHRRSLY